MYAVIDWHVTSPGDPHDKQYDLVYDFFGAFTTQFASSEHVLYEICNEPSGSSVTWSVIADYANQIIPAIRKHDPNAIIIVGTPTWS